jgi:hypothetical protein
VAYLALKKRNNHNFHAHPNPGYESRCEEHADIDATSLKRSTNNTKNGRELDAEFSPELIGHPGHCECAKKTAGTEEAIEGAFYSVGM